MIAYIAICAACCAAVLFSSCATLPSAVTVAGPEWVLSYDKATGVAVHVKVPPPAK